MEDEFMQIHFNFQNYKHKEFINIVEAEAKKLGLKVYWGNLQ